MPSLLQASPWVLSSFSIPFLAAQGVKASKPMTFEEAKKILTKRELRRIERHSKPAIYRQQVIAAAARKLEQELEDAKKPASKFNPDQEELSRLLRGDKPWVRDRRLRERIPKENKEDKKEKPYERQTPYGHVPKTLATKEALAIVCQDRGISSDRCNVFSIAHGYKSTHVSYVYDLAIIILLREKRLKQKGEKEQLKAKKASASQ